MAEENQVTKEPEGEAVQPPSGAQPAQQIPKEPQQIMKEPQGKATQVQRVTTKNPKKKWKLVTGWLTAIIRREKRRNKRNWRPAE